MAVQRNVLDGYKRMKYDNVLVKCVGLNSYENVFSNLFCLTWRP